MVREQPSASQLGVAGPRQAGCLPGRGATTPSNFHKIKNTVTQASQGPAHKHIHNPSKHSETQTKTTETSNQCASKQQTYESQFSLTITLYQSWCCCRPGYVYWVGWAHWASRPGGHAGASGRPVSVCRAGGAAGPHWPHSPTLHGYRGLYGSPRTTWQPAGLGGRAGREGRRWHAGAHLAAGDA